MAISRPALLAGLAVFALISATSPSAWAQADTRPTPEQMKVVHDCAAKQGVELPPPPGPPPGPPPQQAGDKSPGQQQGAGGPPSGPPGPGGPQGQHPPRLTDAQRAVLDACFKANGLTPPHPRNFSSHPGDSAPQGPQGQ